MGRANHRIRTEIAKAEVSPILLVRILNIPDVLPPFTTDSLYLTDCDTNLVWYNENNQTEQYISCGITYNQVEVTTDNQINTATLNIDNVHRAFSSLAQHKRLNGVKCQVFRGYRNQLAYPDGSQLLFSGQLKKAVINEYNIQAEIWTNFSLKKKCPPDFYSIDKFPYIPATKDIRQVYRG